MRSKRKDIKRSYDDIIHDLYISIYKDLCIYDIYIYIYIYIYTHYTKYVSMISQVCLGSFIHLLENQLHPFATTSVGSSLMEVAQMIQVLDVFVLKPVTTGDPP